MASSSGPKAEFLVRGRYKLVWEIGSGSFGQVHLAIDLTNHEQVAVKLESQTARQPRLLHEKELYNILQGPQPFHDLDIFEDYWTVDL